MAKKVKQVAHPVAKSVGKTTKPQTIQVLAKENPKRGQSRTRFAFYKTGMSVDRYIERCEAAGFHCGKADLKWDAAHQYIAIR